MKILVTGSDGFIAKNLIQELRNQKYQELFLCNRKTSKEELELYVAESDVIIHLAGVNRPQSNAEFQVGNIELTEQIINLMKVHVKKRKFIFSSSVQAEYNNPYGTSKKEAEELLKAYALEGKIELYIYRLTNVFGKWCKPNYNSVVATFCNNIARDLDIRVNDANAKLNLVYIDDVVSSFINVLENEIDAGGYVDIEPEYQVTVGELANLIAKFKELRYNYQTPDMSDDFEKKLYSTYLSYLDVKDFMYPLKMNVDERGSFTEFLRSGAAGQVSINVAKPGIVKGNHWHHTKVEKFLVVKGKAQISFRNMITNEIIDYVVSGEKLEAVDIPTGYTHNIKNIGEEDLVTVMWANEPFNPEKPDTYYEEV